jgi:hypothetical protein
MPALPFHACKKNKGGPGGIVKREGIEKLLLLFFVSAAGFYLFSLFVRFTWQQQR